MVGHLTLLVPSQGTKPANLKKKARNAEKKQTNGTYICFVKEVRYRIVRFLSIRLWFICYVVILPNTPAAESLTPAEIERRTNSFNARRTLLRSNPSLFISKTRLSIRQIPIFVTERVLKRLAVHAVRIFETEVKKGLRAGLTSDELTEVVDGESGDESQVKEEEGEKEKKKPHKKGERGTGVKQTKIVRQHERVDPITGKGRSKGYGFLEMLKHADALRVLRWTNNNPDVGPLFEKWWKDELEDLIKQEKNKDDKDEARLKRMKDELEKSASRQSKGTLIAEFSIENVQVVQRRFALQKDRGIVRITLPVPQLRSRVICFRVSDSCGEASERENRSQQEDSRGPYSQETSPFTEQYRGDICELRTRKNRYKPRLFDWEKTERAEIWAKGRELIFIFRLFFYYVYTTFVLFLSQNDKAVACFAIDWKHISSGWKSGNVGGIISPDLLLIAFSKYLHKTLI
jgi:hypothetical protein